MKHSDFDVIIVGGGLVGAALALALRHSALEVAVLETAEPPACPPEDWDARVYAISRASQALLTRIGAWQALDPARLAPVSGMRIRGDRTGARLDFDALEAGCETLTHIVENRHLQAVLWQKLREAPNVTLITAVQAQALQIDAHRAALTLADGRCLHARLIVGADGANSWVRRQLAIDPLTLPYQQFGVVANFNTGKPHHGLARQWFRKDGILAWLPLPGARMSMVWSCSAAEKDALLALPAEELAQRVAAAGNHELGQLAVITPAQAFPLRLNHVPEIVRSRVALVGDAAHTVHPLAGQGVNLGFGDVATLAGILTAELPERAGDYLVLRRYERDRREAVYLMQGVCHGLQKLFNNDHPVLGDLRNWGLALTNRLPWLKRQLIRHAMDA
ncbi:UbiH/UbiF family hydroxylase [Chitinilyticum litopenaei]|uniref:UbiH/UbiF family hydroxylase n=1 Tax=Chitinilyticum litopenaei TaxID=1121276 RepID=UPI0004167055|nr:UbiH/UbiF family hydroxylase [Chitinilyticum litopenaei]